MKRKENIHRLDDALHSLDGKALVVIDAWRAARRGGWECWNSVTGGRTSQVWPEIFFSHSPREQMVLCNGDNESIFGGRKDARLKEVQP